MKSALKNAAKRILPNDIGERLAGTEQKLRRWYFEDANALSRPLYVRGARSYKREKSAFHAGARKYYRESSAERQRYELRRHVHMIEKGLCMRPRRSTFAGGYIQGTVNAFINVFPRLDEQEREWMTSVLNSYRDATAASDDPRVQQARDALTSSSLLVHGPTDSAPHPVGTLSSQVTQSDLLELVDSRTSVRWYSPEIVSRQIIDTAVSTALQAPTACNRIPWQIRIFDTPEESQRVAKLAMGTAGYLDSIQNLAVFVGNQSAYFDERDRHLIYIDASLAAMSFVLSLQAADVSSCCINWPDIPKREVKMANVLGLEDYERVVMLVAFGYADPKGLTPFSGKKSLDAARSYS